MDKTIISEGRTTSEAIEKGLKQLKVTKNQVEIKVLKDENKKSFFSILAPRNVRVELKLKENINEINKEEIESIDENEFFKIKENINTFLKDFFEKAKINDIQYEIINENKDIKVDMKGKNINNLIGYRGETLNALQTILSRIGNKNLEERHKIIVDIEGYRDKRINALEGLADKIAKTVEKKQKSITLEAMSAFERKIIHNRLQDNSNVTTHSIGKEPNRKVVIELKNK